MARLELARRTAYHAADETPIAGDALGAIAPDALMETTFEFAPAVQIVSSGYLIAAIWHFNMTKGAPAPEAVGETALITRPALDLEMNVIGSDQALFFNMLINGETLSAASEAATQMNGKFDLSGTIVLMLQSKLITKLKS
ncbi:MAG: hypothetical protein QNK92_05400 [Amylibacter sp.]